MFSKRGFTLTEMLFVVLIAAGVLALAFPSYKNVVNRSKNQAAIGRLVDLGSAVEAITRDLAIQGVNAYPVDTGETSYIALALFDTINGDKKTLKEVYLENPTSATVVKMLVPFGYLEIDASYDTGGDGYSYYVGRGPNNTCVEDSEVNPLSGRTVIACALKVTSTEGSTSCSLGARYFQGGQVQTLRGSECKK